MHLSALKDMFIFFLVIVNIRHKQEEPTQAKARAPNPGWVASRIGWPCRFESFLRLAIITVSDNPTKEFFYRPILDVRFLAQSEI